MSCAVMFQPCVSMDAPPPISERGGGIESPSHSLISTVGGSVGEGLSPRPQHPQHSGQPQGVQKVISDDLHRQNRQNPVTHRDPKGSKSPFEEHNDKEMQKPCPTTPESCPNSLNNQSLHQDIKHPSLSSLPSLCSAHPINEKDVKYLSANCVVVTHYRGDTSAVVDEHFSRALAVKPFKGNDSHFKVAPKNFPPSFYQPDSGPRPPVGVPGHLGSSHATTDLYEAYHSGLHSIQTPGNDPWGYGFSPQSYAHRSVSHDIYHSAMTSASHPYQYSTLGFQQPFSRLPTVPVPPQINKSDGWGSRYYETFVGASDLSSGMDTAASYSSAHYHNVAGIESGMSQECAKDLYWL